MQLSPTKIRVGLASGLVAGALGLAVFTGLGPAPALSSVAEHGDDDGGRRGDDDGTTGTTDTTAGSTAAPVAAGSRTFDAAGAGTVTVNVSGAQLSLVSAVPNSGWQVEVEQAAGREVELDFRLGSQRVQVNVELEDGAVRERVRFRDEATGTDILIENGMVVEAEGVESQAGQSGSGTSGRRGDDDGVDDDDSGGHGSDDGSDDDHGGSRGRGGADDGPGDDHGGDD
jgi:hypothetical protein